MQPQLPHNLKEEVRWFPPEHCYRAFVTCTVSLDEFYTYSQPGESEEEATKHITRLRELALKAAAVHKLV